MDFQQLQTVLLTLLDSILQRRSCAYVAGPLESGLGYYEQLATGKAVNVRDENQKRLAKAVQQLRAVLPYPVFDPGVLRIHGWSDAEHGVFFIQVMERYAKEVWFLDGWE